MLANDETALRGFCCRLLGFSIERAAAVEHAFRTLELVMAHRVSLVVLGEFDLVPIAQTLHRLMVGTEAPFILSDWRRENTPASVRGAGNQRIGALALQGARGGTLCVRCQRLPRDFKALVAQLRGTEEVRLTVVGDGRYDTHPFLVRRRRSGSRPSRPARGLIGELTGQVIAFIASSGLVAAKAGQIPSVSLSTVVRAGDRLAAVAVTVDVASPTAAGVIVRTGVAMAEQQQQAMASEGKGGGA